MIYLKVVMSVLVCFANVAVNEQVLLFSRANEIRGVDLKMPYFHTIPTISLPQVLSPSQLDFVATSKKIYWTDVQVNEVKRTNLTGGGAESIIDTGMSLSYNLPLLPWATVFFFTLLTEFCRY